MTCKPWIQLVIVFNYVRTLSNYVWHLKRLCQIIECFIASSVAKDCLALSQNDLHHGTFLLVTPKVMPSYKSTIIQRKSTSLQWHAVFSKLCSKVKKTPSLSPYVEDVLFVNKPGVTSFRVVTSPKLWAVFSFAHPIQCWFLQRKVRLSKSHIQT